MKKIKAIIIDDENLAREIIKQYLEKFPEIEIVDECNNGFEAVKSISKNNPDFIFLDIQMPKINGFEMLELIENYPQIIFTTAYDQFAIKAFEVNAIDYLLKPFSFERFNSAIEKLMKVISIQSSQKKIEKVSNYVNEKIEYLDRIVVKENSNIHIINIEMINWIEANDDYVNIHTDEKKYLKNRTMKYYEQHLNPTDFIRVHRSSIVNIKKIKKLEMFEKDSYRIILADSTKLNVSKAGYEKIKEQLYS